MQAHYPQQFEREVGFALADWERTLQSALRACGAEGEVKPGAVSARWPGGSLELHWAELAPRQIALVRLPRLAVRFAFDGADDGARQRFMRHFDLYMQRGGG